MIGSKILSLPLIQRWMASAIHLPPPGGPYPVGTREFTLTHPIRLGEVGSPRKIGIKAWYPANPNQAPCESYFSTEAMGQLHAGKSANHFAYLAHVSTHSVPGAPLVEIPSLLPVLMYSHGHGLSNRTNTLVCEHLASHGYVVLAIGHPGEGFCTVIDGELVGLDSTIMEPLLQEGKAFYEAHRDLSIKDDPAAYIRLMIEENVRMAERVQVWSDDLKLTADWIDQGSDPYFAGKLMRGAFGAFGHSIGGAVALRMLKVDDRFKCGVNLDGGQFGGDYLDWISNRPMMVLSGNIAGLRSGFHPDQKNVYWVNIQDANHLFFSDGMLVYGTFARLLIPGKVINGKRMLMILRSVLAAFFDQYLRNIPVDVGTTASSFSEIQYLYENGEGSQ